MRLGKTRYESKYMAIKELHSKKKWSIEWMCKQLEISRAAYYKWINHEKPDAEIENIKLAELIKEYDERFNHILGYRRILYNINKYHNYAPSFINTYPNHLFFMM